MCIRDRGWADITWDNYLNINIPWLTEADKKKRVNLYYASVLMSPEYMFIRNKFFKLATTIISPLMKFRVKKLNFTLPVEIAAARAIHHGLL